MCTANTGKTACDATKTWSAGWIVITGAEVLRVWDAASYICSNTVKSMGYKANGLREPVTTETTFKIDSNCINNPICTVKVSPIGRGTKDIDTCPL